MSALSPRRHVIPEVKSGIALNSFHSESAGNDTHSSEVFLTSRFARVLLAGSGFLADAVSRPIYVIYVLG